MTKLMRFKGAALAAVATTLAFSLAVPAVTSASTKVIGAPLAGECSRLALAGESDRIALRTCNLALESEPLGRSDAAKTHVNRAVIHLRRQDLRHSESDLAEAERLMPSLAEVFVNRGAVYIHQRRYDEALKQIDRGIALDPSEPEKAYYNRAVVRERIGDLKGAYSDYRRAIALAPTWEAPKKQLARFQVE